MWLWAVWRMGDESHSPGARGTMRMPAECSASGLGSTRERSISRARVYRFLAVFSHQSISQHARAISRVTASVQAFVSSRSKGLLPLALCARLGRLALPGAEERHGHDVALDARRRAGRCRGARRSCQRALSSRRARGRGRRGDRRDGNGRRRWRRGGDGWRHGRRRHGRRWHGRRRHGRRWQGQRGRRQQRWWR